MKLRGIFPPLTTPFSDDGDIDLKRLRKNIERYNQTKLSGYVMNGSTGEPVLLSGMRSKSCGPRRATQPIRTK